MDVQANKRIDAGIKRGPRQRSKLGFERSPKADLGAWVIPEGLKPQDVLDRYLTESTTSQIAAQYGLSRKALVRWLRQVAPEQWREVQLIRAHVNLENGEDGIDDAEARESAISLACARERIKAAQFRLQALDEDYRPKQSIEMTVTGDLGERLLRARERVIDAESTVIAAPAQLSNNKQLQPDAPQQTGNGPA